MKFFDQLAKARLCSGILEPRGFVCIMPQPPVGANERPMVVTPTKGDVSMKAGPVAGSIIVTNERDAKVEYVFSIMPEAAVAIGMGRWDMLASQALRVLAGAIEKKGG